MFRLLKILFLLFIFAFGQMACQSKTENSDRKNTGASAAEQKTQEAWSQSGEIVQKITLSPSHIIRNVDWGQSVESIVEKLELSENQPATGKSFTLYLDNSDLNFADITYIPDAKNQIKEIDIDVFLEENDQVLELIEGFQTYLNAKIGPSKAEGKKIQWGPKQNTQVTLEDMSTAKDPGIKLIFKQVP
jgi:hypothetical protein